MVDCKAVMDMKSFFEIINRCREVTEEYRIGRPPLRRLFRMLLRLPAPLM